jgi:large conductance mechanosensitive channel
MSEEDEILKELKRIRELLEPKPAPPPPQGLWNEFMDFLSKYKVMGLAVAFIMGIYLGNLIQALVQDIIMPAIGLTVPGLGNFAAYTVEFNRQNFLIGDFLAALVTFVIVAFVIFMLVKVTRKWGIE